MVSAGGVVPLKNWHYVPVEYTSALKLL